MKEVWLEDPTEDRLEATPTDSRREKLGSEDEQDALSAVEDLIEMELLVEEDTELTELAANIAKSEDDKEIAFDPEESTTHRRSKEMDIQMKSVFPIRFGLYG